MILLGVGLGLVFAPGFSLATYGVEASDSGVASATVNTMQQVGGSVGTALLNTIAASAGAPMRARTPRPRPGPAVCSCCRPTRPIHSYTTAFWWAAAIFAVGAVLSAIVLRPGTFAADPESAGAVVV